MFSLLLLESCDDYSHKTLTPIAQSIEEFETFIKDTMKQANIPGLSIAVIEDGKPVFVKGYGVTKRIRSVPVDENTQMKISSITKPLTSLMIARLVDAKKFDWSTKIIDMYPEFRVANEKLAQVLKICCAWALVFLNEIFCLGGAI